MKKIAVLFLLVVFGLLAGCSDSQGETGASGQEENVELRYAIWDVAQQPAMEEIAQKFNEEHENIEVKVELSPFDTYWTKLEAAATGESVADIFWMNPPNFLKYASNDLLLPVSERIKESENVDLSNYPQGVVDMYSHEGEVYALPKDFDTIGLWYNKELFDNANVDYPDDSWKWEDLIQAAEKLTDPSTGVWGMAANLHNRQGYYLTAYQNEGYILSEDKQSSGFDQPETIEGLKKYTDLIHEHEVSPTLAEMTDMPVFNMFQSGKLAMLFAGSWNAKSFNENEYLSENADVAILPEGKVRATSMSGLGNVISAKTEHPEEAWEFLKFLGSEEAAKIQAESGTVIPAFQGTEQAWVEAIPHFNLQAFIDMAPYGIRNPATYNTSKWQSIENEYMAKALAGEITTEEAAKHIAEEMNKILAEEH